MSKFRQLIFETLQEAKQVGLLYHSTSLEAALDRERLVFYEKRFFRYFN